MKVGGRGRWHRTSEEMSFIYFERSNLYSQNMRRSLLMIDVSLVTTLPSLFRQHGLLVLYGKAGIHRRMRKDAKMLPDFTARCTDSRVNAIVEVDLALVG